MGWRTGPYCPEFSPDLLSHWSWRTGSDCPESPLEVFCATQRPRLELGGEPWDVFASSLKGGNNHHHSNLSSEEYGIVNVISRKKKQEKIVVTDKIA